MGVCFLCFFTVIYVSTSSSQQSSIPTSPAAIPRQLEKPSHERAVYHQLQKLQVQEPAKTSQMSMPAHKAKLQALNSSQRKVHQKQERQQLPLIPDRGLSHQQSAENSQSNTGDVNSGVSQAQPMKLEVEANDTLSQGGVDPFWRCNPVSQATQVHLS